MLVTSIFPFPAMFSVLPKTNFNFSVASILSSVYAFNLDQPETLSFGKELSRPLLKENIAKTDMALLSLFVKVLFFPLNLLLFQPDFELHIFSFNFFLPNSLKLK